jgi:ribosomal protein S18 acetylase RimI-like enzyme
MPYLYSSSRYKEYPLHQTDGTIFTMIKKATIPDITSIAKIELGIEGDDAATAEVLLSRLRMFPEGFLVCEDNNSILGYVESCRWDIEEYTKFIEIKNFPKLHNSEGSILYIIYLATAKEHRNKGVASQLVQKLQEYVHDNNVTRIHLVAKNGLIPFYSELGFTILKELPGFLPGSHHTLMEYCTIPPSLHTHSR